MILFSNRVKLASEYKKWAMENNILDCPESVIAFIQRKGLLYDGTHCEECVHYEEDPCDPKVGTCVLTKRETNAEGYCDRTIKAEKP